MLLMTGNPGKQPDARIHMQIFKNSTGIKQNLSCINLLSHIGQNYARLPTQLLKMGGDEYEPKAKTFRL